MKVLLDTNLIVDVALERQPFYRDSLQVMSLIYQRRIEGYISASTISDLYYIIRKTQGHDLTLDFLQRIATFCATATVDAAVISMALAANFSDFEDAIQHSTAVVNQLDAIATRNPQDFPKEHLQIFTPAELIQHILRS